MTLTAEHIILIGSLTENQGFQYLLKALQAEEDTLLLALEAATTNEEEQRITANWRAYRRVIARLDQATTSFKEYSDAAFNGLNPEIPTLDALE